MKPFWAKKVATKKWKKISSREPLHSGKRHQLRRRFEARTVASFDT